MAFPENMCGFPLPVEFVKMLAATLMKDSVTGDVIGFNFTMSSARSCNCTPVVDCDNNHVPPESLLQLGFELDDCGHLAIKLVNCDGTFVEEEQT